MFRASVVAVFLLMSQPEPAGPATFRVDPAESRLEIEVGRAGLLKMFGHDHLIVAESLSGQADWNEAAPETSRFTLEIESASLTVADEELSDEERGEVQSDMETKALAAREHPTIRFVSSAAKVSEGGEGAYEVELDGTLSLRGVDASLRVPMTVELEGDVLRARGELELDSDAWGVPQISAVGGTVKTRNELGIRFEIVARAAR